MAASTRKPKAALRAALSDTETLVLAGLVAAVVFGLGLLGASAVRASWVSDPEQAAAEQGAPHWLTTETLRATSRDGVAVKARLVLDAPDPDTRAWISRRPQQVALVMQISVAEHDRGEAVGSERVQRLASDVQSRLNDYLQASQVPPVREVVIQDLVFSTP